MGAEQFGQGITLGATTLSCCARRLSRLLLDLSRLGTATGLLLRVVLQSTRELCKGSKPRVNPIAGAVVGFFRWPGDSGVIDIAQVRTQRNHRELKKN